MKPKKRKSIKDGKTVLGIEFGSTRIKSVLLDENNEIVAIGNYDWENSYENGVWTYSLDEVWKGLQASYRDLTDNIKQEYEIELKKIASIGISAMMHGYLAFDRNDKLLVPFRTWRNNFTGEASEKLTDLFNYPIPQRWSIAHLYQAILNGEEHVNRVNYITTLAGYVHWQLSGEKVLGIGDASGMFPIDIKSTSFNKKMFKQFNNLIADENYDWEIEEIMPKVLKAGEDAGVLTKKGAKLLDTEANLEAGSLMCAPEGDAGTGMVATNSVAERTGNVSAGTSIFAMVVLEDELDRVHAELDLVTTPSGNLVAMSHSNNCTSSIDSWIKIFKEAIETLGFEVDTNELYENLYKKSLEGDKDCGGLLAYGYLSGEHMTGFEEGRPLFVRSSDSNFNLANFIRVNLQSALGAMKIGMDILLKDEGVKLDKMLGHGGMFKTEGVAQRYMSAAVNAPVSVMETAGEGGAWGIALLASYHLNKSDGQSLEDFLDENVFVKQNEKVIEASTKDVEGFKKFMERYKKGLAIERAAVENLK